MLLDKWRFNTSQDWKVLGADFESVSLETIPNATLQALGFHHSRLGYLGEGTPRVVDVIDKLELAIKPEDDSQPILDLEDKKAKKGLERAAKRKTWHNNLCASV